MKNREFLEDLLIGAVQLNNKKDASIVERNHIKDIKIEATLLNLC